MDGSSTYTKSAKGVLEISSHVQNLDLKSRQVLILTDGHTTVARIQQLRPRLDIQAIVARLLREGFLEGEISETVAPLSSATPAPGIAIKEPTPVSREKLDEVRTIMAESTLKYTGILGADLFHKISIAQDAAQIKNCISQWNMAMRESRQGKKVADQLLHAVHLAMGM